MQNTQVAPFNEYMSTNHSTVDLTKGGQCTQCGGCCTNSLQLTSTEIKEIRNYVRKHKIKPHVINLPTVDRCLDATCPFLNMDKKTERCNIYPVRPHICKVFSCGDKDMTRYLADPKLMNRQYTTIDMRETFFPSSSSK